MGIPGLPEPWATYAVIESQIKKCRWWQFLKKRRLEVELHNAKIDAICKYLPAEIEAAFQNIKVTVNKH